jgi:hypothetical protein
MSVYGVSGSATYAVTLPGLDQLMDILPNNNVQEITAQDLRNVVYTLWENGGGGGGSFSYTQTPPFSQGSVNVVGGIGSGTTFSNVSLQDLLDRMFFPAQGTGFSISANPSSLEYNFPNQIGQNPTTTITVTITKKNPTINTAQVTSSNLLSFGAVNIPTTFGGQAQTTYNNVLVAQNVNTTYTLSLNDGTARSDSASVTWYFPGYFGSVNLSQNATFAPLGSYQFGPSSTVGQINALIAILDGPDDDWEPVWNSSGVTNFTKKDGASPATTGSIGSLGHKVLIMPLTWYGGDGQPNGFTDNGLPATPFYLLPTIYSVKNQYGYSQNCRIYVSYIQSAGASTYGIT